MKYAVEMDSSAMIYIYQVSYQHLKLMEGRNSQAHREHGALICLLVIFQNKKNKLKIENHIIHPNYHNILLFFTFV
jgi:hypothetical protein